MDAVDFFDLILPDENDGLRCAFVLPDKRNYFFKTNKELAAFIMQMDASGVTVYHACSAYKDNTSRKAQNVSSVSSFWADIDVGPAKTYKSLAEAVRALADAVKAARLPNPLVVCSGRGLHCYWPLLLRLELGEFKRLSKRLRIALGNAGLELDPGRTVDAASILRTPGTFNRKEETPLPVFVAYEIADQYPNQLFDFLLKDTPNEPKAVSKTFVAPAHLKRNIPSDVRARISAVAHEQSASLNLIAGRCEQVRRLRDWRIYRELPEPVWNLICGVAYFCGDGPDQVHGWSEGHNAYVPEQTQAKIDAKAVLTGAPTCEAFHNADPDICKRCSLFTKINSPISLGYDRGNVYPLHTAQALPTAAIAAPEVEDCPKTLPEGFGWKGNSLYFITSNKDGSDNDLLVSKYPIYVQGVNEGESRNEYNLTFRQWLPAKQWFSIELPSKTFLGQSGIAELSQWGANIHSTEHFFRYAKHQIDEIHSRGKVGKTYDQYGWKEGNTAFLFGNKLFTKDGPRDAAFNSELRTRNQWVGAGCNAKGNPESFGLALWQEAANQLFAEGHEAQSIAVLAAFASVFMRFIVTDEGGAILSWVTRETGKGKTTALAGAFSVWGDKKGLAIHNEDNRVTKGLTLGALGNLPLIHDELTAKDPVALKAFVMMFTNGRDKMRATREGFIRHSLSEWQTLMLTAGNASVVDALSSDTSSDAASYRVIEFPIEHSDRLAGKGDAFKQQLINNAGYAGEYFIRYIVQPEPLRLIKRMLPQYMDMIRTQAQLDDRHRFWLRASSCIAVAACIVNAIGLLDFSPNRIIDWLIKYITPANSTITKVGAKDWVVEALAEFITIEGTNFLVLPVDPKPGHAMIRATREPRNQIAGMYAVREKKLRVSWNTIRKFALEHEIPMRDWLAQLQKRGAVGEVHRHNLCAGTDVPGVMMNVITIDLGHEILAGVGQGLSISHGDDPTNVTPLRR